MAVRKPSSYTATKTRHFDINKIMAEWPCSPKLQSKQSSASLKYQHHLNLATPVTSEPIEDAPLASGHCPLAWTICALLQPLLPSSLYTEQEGHSAAHRMSTSDPMHH
uniref:Uncharacterized protein n=1 Tax=Salix viminalis TaxID=40686 RepID=A0A6N2L3I1_SALVM